MNIKDPLLQCFSSSASNSNSAYRNYFPSDVLKWMKKNASPKMLLKLMQICKYFQHKKFPYYVTKEISYCFTWTTYQGYDVNMSLWCIDSIDDSEAALKEEHVENIPNNLWAIGGISLSKCEIPPLLSKISVCDISSLSFCDQQILVNEFKLFTSGGTIKYFYLDYSKIINDNSEVIPLEDIFECLPKMKFFLVRSNVPSIKSINVFETAVPSGKLEIKLWDIEWNFDYKSFFTFMIKHQHILYALSFNSRKQDLIDSIKNILKAWEPRFQLPFIYHTGQTNPELVGIRKRHNKLRKEWFNNNIL